MATAEEALELRGNGIKKPVLVLGPVPECQYGSMVEQEIRTAVFDLTRAERLSEMAVSLGMTARVHIAVDTGMNRIGLRPVPGTGPGGEGDRRTSRDRDRGHVHPFCQG